jgi:P27 family predicted phage terminase small subunit
MKGRHKNPAPARDAGNPPACPAWLDDAARGVWAGLVPRLRHVEELDEYALACFCVTFNRWRTAETDIEANGLRIGNKPNPSVRQSDALLKQLRGLLNELGLTPASRGRRDTGGDGKHEDEHTLDALVDG